MAHALAVLGWLELPEADQPPEHLWLDDEGLAEHFTRVRARYASPTASTDEHVPLDQNELTKGLK